MMTMPLAEVVGRKLNLKPTEPNHGKSYGCKFCPFRFPTKETRQHHTELRHFVENALSKVRK